MLSAEAEKIIIRTRTLCDGRGEKSPYVSPIKGDFTGFPRLQTSL